LKLRTFLTGAALTVLTFTSAGAATFVGAVTTGALSATSGSFSGSATVAGTMQTGLGVPAGVLAIHGSNYLAATPATSGAFVRGLVYSVAAGDLSAGFIGVRSAGTYAAPTACNATGSLALVVGDGFDGTNWVSAGSFGISPSEAWDPAHTGTTFNVSITRTGTTGTVGALTLDYLGLSLPQTGGAGSNLGVGTTATNGQAVRIVGTQTVRVDQYGVLASATFNASATTSGMVYYSSATFASGGATMPAAYGFYADDWGVITGGGAITKQYGIYVAAQTRGATKFAMGFGGNTQTTIGANGGASALTALPLGYLKIEVNGTSAIIPYYNA
jgi:hypothetical protein